MAHSNNKNDINNNPNNNNNNSIVCALVEDKDRNVLENYEQTIVKLMDPDRISRLLVEKGVIDLTDRKQILINQATGERNKILLGKLLTRGPEAFKNYVNALTESRTKNHTKLVKILQNENSTSASAWSAEEKIPDVRHKRINERIENHERRLAYLEESVSEGWVEDNDAECIRAELAQKHSELDELRQKLRTRDGELQEAREENKLLNKRIQSLEKKIASLETCLKEQKARMEILIKQQQQDKRSLKAMEDKNARLESRMESSEKKMEKKFQDQEKRHHKEFDELKQLLRASAKQSGHGNHDTITTTTTTNTKTSHSSTKKASTSTPSSHNKTATKKHTSESGNSRNVPREAAAQEATCMDTSKNSSSSNGSSSNSTIVPKNRFQAEQTSTPTIAPVKYFRAPPAVKIWKKSSADPEKQETEKTPKSRGKNQ